MKFVTFLNKHFDVHSCVERHTEGEGDNKRIKEVTELWIFEKGEDSEPLLILRDAMAMVGVAGWIVGNVYSKLTHGLLVTEQEFRVMVKNGEVVAIQY